jgi:hypothetical protein
VKPTSSDWHATVENAGLRIKGKALYPNDFSTSSLKRRLYTLADKETLTFELHFNRDKEPYCDKNLIGDVHHFERHIPEMISIVRVISDDGQDYTFPISTV